MISFSTGKLRGNTCFQQIRSLFSFSISQTEKKFVKQIGEIIRWFRVKRVATPIYGSHPCRSSWRVHRCRFGQTHRTGTVPNMTQNVTFKIVILCLILLQVPKCFVPVQIFWAIPKIWLYLVPLQKLLCRHKNQFYWIQTIYLSGTKCLWLPHYVNKFLD